MVEECGGKLVVESDIPEWFDRETAIAMGLDARDIQQAVAEGVNTMVGFRRIEKNNRRATADSGFLSGTNPSRATSDDQ
jgi:hypothetical protein